MKTSNKILLTGTIVIGFLILSFMFYNKYAEESVSVKGNNQVKWTRIETGSFNAVSISMIDCEIIPSDSFYTEIFIDNNLVEFFTPTVVDNTLRLKIKNGKYHYKSKPMLRIYCPQINKLSISSSKSCKANIQTEHLAVDLNSSGKLDLTGNFNLLELVASSSARCNLKGMAKIGKFDASSSATINALDLSLDIAEIETSSAATVRVNVLKSITAEASSASVIQYAGKPIISNCTATSAGQVTPL